MKYHVATTAYVSVFFFNDTATTEIYTLSLHDALPICQRWHIEQVFRVMKTKGFDIEANRMAEGGPRSEEHTSELQSRQYLVCRLLLEKKNQRHVQTFINTKKLTYNNYIHIASKSIILY